MLLLFCEITIKASCPDEKNGHVIILDVHKALLLKDYFMAGFQLNNRPSTVSREKVGYWFGRCRRETSIIQLSLHEIGDEDRQLLNIPNVFQYFGFIFVPDPWFIGIYQESEDVYGKTNGFLVHFESFQGASWHETLPGLCAVIAFVVAVIMGVTVVVIVLLLMCSLT